MVRRSMADPPASESSFRTVTVFLGKAWSGYSQASTIEGMNFASVATHTTSFELDGSLELVLSQPLTALAMSPGLSSTTF